MGKKQTQTTAAAPDAQSQAYINQLRQQGQGAANVALQHPGSFFTGPLTGQQIQESMNPYLSQVVDATRGEFDHLRNQAMMGTDQEAMMGGAYGGARHGIAAGARLGEIDRAQTSQIAGLLNQGYGQATQLAQYNQGLRQQQAMEPLWRQQQALQMMNFGMGPVGMNQTTTQGGNFWHNLGETAKTGAAIGSLIMGGR